MSGLQQPDGSFFGDEWGEVDTRFSYCALSSMAIIGQLDSGKIDLLKAAEFVGRRVDPLSLLALSKSSSSATHIAPANLDCYNVQPNSSLVCNVSVG